MPKTSLKKSNNVKASGKAETATKAKKGAKAKAGAKVKGSVRNKPVAKIDRREMVAREAYLRAERRGFSGGDPVQDWLEAEKDIDAMLRKSA
jgi:hypothetical protein